VEQPVSLTIDGQEVTVPAGTTLWEAARGVGIAIPVLCHDPEMDPVGVCRVCTVEVEGARVLAAACIRPAEAGMVVRTTSDRAVSARKIVTELLLADHPRPCEKQRQWGTCDLENLASELGLAAPRFAAVRRWEGKGNGAEQAPVIPDAPSGSPSATGNGAGSGGHSPQLPHDLSSPVIAVDHSACILCDRCIRACDELQSNEVIGRTGKGHGARISFDDDRPMGQSTCVSCGECMAHCPTGALTDKPLVVEFQPAAMRPVPTVCPYCGVGCSLTYHVQEGKVARATARRGPANDGRLCVKGRYGFDYSTHPQRLTVPLIRRAEFYPKGPLSSIRDEEGDYRRKRRGSPPTDYGPILAAFREATWDEALDRCAARLLAIKAEHGPNALAGFGSAKCTNEDTYVFQKLVRAAFGTNNVDHCTRLCHASSVAALMETIGSGAVSNPFADVALADVCLVIGSNTTENHPVAATFIKRAAKRGTTLIVADPRRPALARHAHHYLRFKPGTDVALLNGLAHVILAEGLQDDAFIRERTEGFAALRETVAAYSPEVVEKITGIPAPTIVAVARLYGNARAAIIFWGMGISQHTTGTDNARALIALSLLTGNVGRPGTGLHPLRGQNNVQGASDMGLIPMVYSGYQPVNSDEVRARFEAAWRVPLDPQPGLTVVEIMKAALSGEIRGMLMMGENPFLSDPNVNKVRQCLASLEFLAVQDIFLTETAEFADVILPATTHAEKEGTYTNTDRCVQLARQAMAPPGQARSDWEVLVDLSRRMGYAMEYASAAEIFAEMAALTPDYGGLSHARLAEGPVYWPCPTPESAGEKVIFTDSFPRGRARFSPVEWAPARELPDAGYPFVLNTGRVLEHWHTGTMTRRARALDALSPEPFVEIHPEDAAGLGIAEGDPVRVRSRRGSIVVPARIRGRACKGSVFIPFHFVEAAANVLTIDALDPTAKIPEYKYCAVHLELANHGEHPA
jgi:formate dehydrogenase major subunit